MNAFQEIGVSVLGQVTAITLLAGVMALMLGRRHSAARHAVGVTALGLVLFSPVISLLLPRGTWWSDSSERTPSTSGVAASGDASQWMRADHGLEHSHSLPRDKDEDDAARAGTETRELVANRNGAQGAVSPASSWWLAMQQSYRGERAVRWWRITFAAGSVWLVGVLWLSARWLISYRRVRRVWRDLQPWPTGDAGDSRFLRNLLDEVRAVLHVRELPVLRVSETLPLPVVVGVWSPVVVIPRALLTGSPQRLGDVLIHECAHVARRDPWVHGAQRLAGILFWVHPGVWWLNAEIARSREEICDNFVLGQSDSADYAQTLLELAEQCAAMPMTPRWLGLLSSRWTLEERVSGLLHPSRSLATCATRGTVLTVLLAFAALSWLAGGVRERHVAHAENADEGKSSRQAGPAWKFLVVDESGAAVPGAKWNAEGWPGSLTGTSDSTGLCHIGGLHHGTIVVSDEQGRMGYATAWRQRLSKTERIVMKKPRLLMVRVVDQNGKGVAKADVNIIADAGPIAFGQTGRDGAIPFAIPADAPVQWVAAKKKDVGFDYFENYDSFPGWDFKEPPLNVRLTLDGARRIEARVLDISGQPIVGVLVYPWTIQKRDKLADINNLDRLFHETSDADGRVAFEGMPAEFLGAITLLPKRDGFHDPSQTSVRSDPIDRWLTLKMTRNARLSGRVVGNDGQPVHGLTLHVKGRGATNMYFRKEIVPDESGRYEISVPSGQAYLLAVEHADFAALAHLTPVLKEREEWADLNFSLSTGTQIRGRATVGKTPLPAKGQTVTLIQQAGNVPEAREFYGTTSIDLVRWTETDEDGRYSFRVGPGEYRLQLPHQPFEQRASLAIKGEREVVCDYHAEHPERGSLSGRATFLDGKPAERATVYGQGVPSSRGAGFRSRTDRNGHFKTERWIETTLMMATSADGRFAGVGRATPDDETVNIPLTPAAKLVGRLLDLQMKPVTRQRVTALVGQSPLERVIHLEAVTDETGRYEIPLAVGWWYEVHVWPDNKPVTIAPGETAEATTYKIPDFVMENR